MQFHLTLWDNSGPQTVSQGTHKHEQNGNLRASADSTSHCGGEGIKRCVCGCHIQTLYEAASTLSNTTYFCSCVGD